MLRSNIKMRLDSIYQLEIERGKKRKNLKDWNGYLDKQSERDGKINELLK